MGLDITYYESYEKVEKAMRDEEIEELLCNNGVMIYTGGFVEQAYPLVDNDLLKGERGSGFRAGSYSSYSYWRNKLANLVHGVDAEYIWKNEDLYRGKAFFEIINFSDCEGIIGPYVSNKLLNDFIEYSQKVQETKDEYFIETYNNFYEAFSVTANTGVVVYH